MLRLNLLPADRKRALNLGEQLQQWRSAIILVVVACVFANVSLFILDRYQSDQTAESVTDVQDWRTLNSKRESGQVTKSTTQLNATVTSLQGIFSPISTSPSIVAALFSILPAEITLSEAAISSDGSFTLTGTAATRASFLALRSTLDASELITNLSTDSTASVREKVPFTYTGKLVLPQ